MTRTTIIGIIIAALAFAAVAAVGIAFGVDHQATSAVIAQVRPAGQFNPLLPIRPGSLVDPLGQLPGGLAIRSAAPFGGVVLLGFGLLLALFVGGGVGALIVYVAGPRQRSTASATTGPAPTPSASGPDDVQYQQFVEWQKFDHWHRQTHAAAGPEGAAAALHPQAETPTSEPTLSDKPRET